MLLKITKYATQQILSISNKLLSQSVNKYATQNSRERLIQFVATKYGVYDVCHQHVGCTFHVSITQMWCPGRWLLQTLQRLTVTFTRRFTTAVFWPSALTGTAGHLLTSAVSRPMGLTNTTKVFRCNQKLVNQHDTISRYTICRDYNEWSPVLLTNAIRTIRSRVSLYVFPVFIIH